METKVAENKTAKNSNEVKTPNPVTEDNKKAAFVSGNPVNKDSVKVEVKHEAEKGKETPKAESPKAEQQKGDVKEETKSELKVEVKEEAKAQPDKQVLNLEGTLKLVEELHRRKIQRDKLLETINNLEAFEFDLKEEMDETGGNVYQGCVLTIEDDTRQKFTTKNPTIIWTVSQMVNRLCVDKLAEIEAGITIPA
jgi:hypothetical protein